MCTENDQYDRVCKGEFASVHVKLDKLDPDWDASDDKLTDLHYGLNLNLERKARLQIFYREGKTGSSYRNHGWLAQVSAKF